MSAELHRKLRSTSPTRRLSGRNATKADVLVYRLDQREYAVKDYSGRSWWVRRWIGRPSIRRESAAYRAAAGARGLAPFHGNPGPLALVTGWLPARPLAEHARGEVPAGAFDRLGEHIAAT